MNELIAHIMPIILSVFIFIGAVILYVYFKYKYNTIQNDMKTMGRKQKFKELVKEIKSETLRECIKFHLEYTENIGVCDSKIGGLPYIPKQEQAVLDDEGDPMFLLAQINCEQLPKNNIYPKEGVLQFYIKADDMYGLELDGEANQGIGHKVVYHQTYETTVTKEDIQKKYNLDNEKYDELPIDKHHTLKLNFNLVKEGINYADYRFDDCFSKKYKEIFHKDINSVFDLPDEDTDYIYDEFMPSDSQIGGYPFFTQDDIRGYDEYKDYDILLLQIDSFEEYIMWGDCGIANFFITQEDLKNKDFSKVLYNWDCT